MRTCVAPHAIAASKSLLIPIDSTGSGPSSPASRSRSARSASKYRRGSWSGGGIVIRPSSRMFGVAATARARGGIGLGNAALARLTGDIDRDQHRLHAAGTLAQLDREVHRVDRVDQHDMPGDQLRLVALQPAGVPGRAL